MTRPRPKCLPRPPSPRPARWAEGPTGNRGKGHVRSDRRGGGREARARPLGVSPPRGFPASVFHAPLPGPRALRTELLSFQPLKATGHSPSCLRLLTRSLGPVDSGFFFFDFLTGVALGAAWWIRCCHVKDPRVLPILVAGAGQTDWAPDGSRRLSRAVPVWLGGPSGCWGPGPVPGVRRSLRLQPVPSRLAVAGPSQAPPQARRPAETQSNARARTLEGGHVWGPVWFWPPTPTPGQSEAPRTGVIPKCH